MLLLVSGRGLREPRNNDIEISIPVLVRFQQPQSLGRVDSRMWWKMVGFLSFFLSEHNEPNEFLNLVGNGGNLPILFVGICSPNGSEPGRWRFHDPRFDGCAYFFSNGLVKNHQPVMLKVDVSIHGFSIKALQGNGFGNIISHQNGSRSEKSRTQKSDFWDRKWTRIPRRVSVNICIFS